MPTVDRCAEWDDGSAWANQWQLHPTGHQQHLQRLCHIRPRLCWEDC
jgi:hypothetical protein